MVQHPPSAASPSGSRSDSVHRPIRTCVGCRERVLAADLLRIVAQKSGTDGFVLLPDPRHRFPGRGVWLHPVSSCLATAERRRALGRALRVSGHLDISAVARLVEPAAAGRE